MNPLFTLLFLYPYFLQSLNPLFNQNSLTNWNSLNNFLKVHPLFKGSDVNYILDRFLVKELKCQEENSLTDDQ